MTESLRETIIRMAKAYNLDVPEFLTKHAEIEQLQKDLILATDTIVQLQGEIEQLKDRIDEHHKMFEPMRAEIERLTAALNETLAGYIATDYYESGIVERAHRALEGSNGYGREAGDDLTPRAPTGGRPPPP